MGTIYVQYHIIDFAFYDVEYDLYSRKIKQKWAVVAYKNNSFLVCLIIDHCNNQTRYQQVILQTC